MSVVIESGLAPAAGRVLPAQAAVAAERSVPIGYLRTFLTLMVVLHHAVLAYHPYAPAPPKSLLDAPQLWPAFPVVDAARWPGIDLLVGFNDIYFMALMFFVSGLFTWRSLERKGAGAFLRDRMLRLGVPFALCASVLAPLAYYPSYLQTGAEPGLAAFAKLWRALPYWPSGPAWFLWVLLVFCGAAALLYRVAPGLGGTLARWASRGESKPGRVYLTLLLASMAVYVPVGLAIDPSSWTSVGPFSFQTARLMQYAVYYFAGVAVGAHGTSSGLLAADGRLAQRWKRWLAAAPLAYFAAVAAFIALLSTLSRGGPGAGMLTACNVTFALSCATSSFMMLALFLRHAQRRIGFFDVLSANAYGIYLVHYVFVSWLQFALLGHALPGALKGTLVFLGATALSLAATIALRRIPVIARIV